MALFSALVVFRLLVEGFSNRTLREHMAQFLGIAPDYLKLGRMTYDLRRLRLHNFVIRVPKTNLYLVTDEGFRTALFYLKVYTRILRPGLSFIDLPSSGYASSQLRRAFDDLDNSIARWCSQAKM